MSDDPVRLATPPPAVLKVANPLLRTVLRTRAGRRMGDLALLEFTGRRTGRHISTPVAVHEVDGMLFTTTDRPWRLNFTGGTGVTLIQRGTPRRATATLLPMSPTEVGTLLMRLLDTGRSPRTLGLRVAKGHVPTVADLAALGLSVIRYDLGAPG